jgi:L-iditol 2-dehydrogenase
MLTAQLTGLREFTLVEDQLPEPGPGELQVRVAAIGICGSDMHAYAEGGVGDSPCKYPMVLGHEPSGTVHKIGEGVTGWSIGDPGALEPAIFCYHCGFCRTGHYNLCENLRFMSTAAVPGFFREFVNVPAHNMLRVAPGTGLAEATLVEPLAVVLHSLKIGSYERGESAVVWGAGPIGLLTIAVLKMFGAPRVWAVEPLAHRREFAKALGADEVFDGADAVPKGAEIAFDCAAKDDSVNRCLGTLKGFGRLVLTGIHSDHRNSLDIHLMRRSELKLFSVRRSNDESNDARDLLVEHARRFAPIITHQRPLEGINEAFGLNERYEDGVGKMLIMPGRRPHT